MLIRVCPGGGGGGYSPQILVGMCRGKVLKKMGGSGASSSVKNAGLRSELERESGGLRNWLYRTRLAGTLAGRYNPGALPERFAFGLAAVNRPWAAMNGLKFKEIF